MQAPLLPRLHSQPLPVVLHVGEEEAVPREFRKVHVGRQLAQERAATGNGFLGAVAEARSRGNALVLRGGVLLDDAQPLFVVGVAVEEQADGGGVEEDVKAGVIVSQVAGEVSEDGTVLVLALHEEVGGAVTVGASGSGTVEGEGWREGSWREKRRQEVDELRAEVEEGSLPLVVVLAEEGDEGHAEGLQVEGIRLLFGECGESGCSIRTFVETVVQVSVQIGGEALQANAMDKEMWSQRYS